MLVVHHIVARFSDCLLSVFSNRNVAVIITIAWECLYSWCSRMVPCAKFGEATEPGDVSV